MPPQIEKVKKLMLLKDNPPLAIFDQLERVNTALADLRDAVNASKTTEMRVNNPEDIKISLDPLQASLNALDASLKDIKDMLATEKEPNDELAKVEQLLQQLVNEEMKPKKEDEKLVKIESVLSLVSQTLENIEEKEFSNINLLPIEETLQNIAKLSQETKDVISVKDAGKSVTDYLSKFEQDGRIKVNVDRVGMGGVVTFPIVDAMNKISFLSSTSTNGTRDLTVADTWYAVPSTVPASPYVLVATIETAVGAVRFGFDNTGTPSATNGNIAPSQLTVRLAGNQCVYYSSSTAGDDVNWTTKII